MKKSLFFVLIAAATFASDIVEIYRHQGLEPIEKELDTQLTQEHYWSRVINRADTTFGYMEKYKSVLVCDKNSSTLKLYQKSDNNAFKLKNEYHAFTGKNKGEKQNEGDLRTPVGIYKLTKKLSKVDAFYGPLAFVTSYPNLYDRYKNKKGHGIWIHGLPINQTRDAFTKGCIAINNDGLECLSQEIELPRTILLIFENKTISKENKKELVKLAAWLYKWRYAWKYNDLEGYLSFYASDFKKPNGMDIEAFRRYKKAVFSRKHKKSIIFDDLNIIPYPNHPGIFQITFYEHYKAPGYRFNGPKELLVRKDANGYKIFGEN